LKSGLGGRIVIFEAGKFRRRCGARPNSFIFQKTRSVIKRGARGVHTKRAARGEEGSSYSEGVKSLLTRVGSVFSGLGIMFGGWSQCRGKSVGATLRAFNWKRRVLLTTRCEGWESSKRLCKNQNKSTERIRPLQKCSFAFSFLRFSSQSSPEGGGEKSVGL